VTSNPTLTGSAVGRNRTRRARYPEFVRRLFVTLISMGLLALIGGATTAATGSGLRGLVTLSPMRPICLEEQPCAKPAAGAVLVFRRNGRAAARVTTRSDGTYRVILRPGTYTVVAPRYRIGSGVTPRTVRVPRGRVARVDLEIDTGIQ
jgi:hypothetical protein